MRIEQNYILSGDLFAKLNHRHAEKRIDPYKNKLELDKHEKEGCSMKRHSFLMVFIFIVAFPLFGSVHFDEIVKIETLPASLVEDKYILKTSDVRDTFNEMLQFHVQHHHVTPLLMGRAYKIFLEQFDRFKMYLLQTEIDQVARLSSSKLERGVTKYSKDDLSDFRELNRVLEQAVLRAKMWREEVERQAILSPFELRESRGESYLAYATDEAQLRDRVSKQLLRFLMEEKQLSGMDDWTPADREKIFTLWEKRFSRREQVYRTGSSLEDHYLALHSLRALATSLDAHTAYFSPEEAREMRAALEKQFEGVGVVLRESIDGIVVVDLIAGGPAEKSRQVQIGDHIVAIDGKLVSEMSYEQVLEAMKGSGGREIQLSLKQKGEPKPRYVTLAREKISMNEERVQFRSEPFQDGYIGVLTLPSFYEGNASSADQDLREALRKLKREGTLKGLVLDMRENSGGFLTQAVKVAGLFVPRGVIAMSKYGRGELKYLRNLDGRLSFEGPFVVLTSKASASATEIVAQALQDYGVALVVGDEHTYGKGTIQIQTVTDPSARAFYKVTVGRYYTVSGRSTQIEGVKADIVVPTIFAAYKIGERFLEYPLANDQVAPAYIDPLTDVDLRSRSWFQKNYLPYLSMPQEKWRRALPVLVSNSQQRLQNNPQFALFIKTQEKMRGRSPTLFRRDVNPEWGEGDLQIAEAVEIVKDMILLDKGQLVSSP